MLVDADSGGCVLLGEAVSGGFVLGEAESVADVCC